MKNIFKIFLPLLFILFLARPAIAQDDKVLYFFYGDGCPHCVEEEKFLDLVISKKYPQFEIKRFEVWGNRDNANLLASVAKKLNIKVSGVPVTIISDQFFIGYQGESTTGLKIEKALQNHLADESCQDFVSPIINNVQGAEVGCQASSTVDNTVNKVKIPFLGEVDVKSLSLPILTVILGSLDGFNPCAMWVLIFLISLLLGMKDRKKMWVLGLAFIFTSAIVYFLFLAAWLNLFLFIGFISWIRIVVALVAIWSGYHYINEFIKNRNGSCEIVPSAGKRKIIDRVKKIVSAGNFWPAFGGIVVLSATISLVELVCSVGLPAIYTQALSMSNLAAWEYYGYLLLYILLYMIDDLLIFVIAMKTLQLKAIGGKYAHWSNLIGGILILIIGILLIFKPGWLMFG